MPNDKTSTLHLLILLFCNYLFFFFQRDFCFSLSDSDDELSESLDDDDEEDDDDELLSELLSLSASFFSSLSFIDFF